MEAAPLPCEFCPWVLEGYLGVKGEKRGFGIGTVIAQL